MPDAQELPGPEQHPPAGHQPRPPGGLPAHRGRDRGSTALARMQEEEAPELCRSQTLLTTCTFTHSKYTLLKYIDNFFKTIYFKMLICASFEGLKYYQSSIY